MRSLPITRAISSFVPAVVGAVTMVTMLGLGCTEPTVAPVSLPDGLPLAELQGAPRTLLRVTLEIGDNILAESDVVVDLDDGTLSGNLDLNNVSGDGEHAAILRAYSRLNADTVEVLLGEARTTMTVGAAGDAFLDFDGVSFESCQATGDGACALRFDANRNGFKNFDDLVGSPAVDPAPQAPFVALAPSTLQFSSGIRLGTFARQIVVLENSGENPMQVESIVIAGGQGVGASLFDPILGVAGVPKRQITPEELEDLVVAPGAELFVAVSFAPVNAFVASANLQVVAKDTVTGVRQGQRSKILANVDGALRPIDAAYQVPELPGSISLGGGGSVPIKAYPPTSLFSGQSVLSFDSAASPGIPKTGATLSVDGTVMPADAAFWVDVRPGERFAASVAGLASDIDVALVRIDEDSVAREVVAVSRNAGTSAEAVEFLNDAATSKTFLVVLGRLDEEDEPAEAEGALVAAERAPVEVICTVTKGPEFDDEAPIGPDRGPIEGGISVQVRGRGFLPGATVTFADTPAGDVTVATDDDGLATLTLTLPPGSLEVGKNPATIVVENPSIENGGDGQAATLPAGFTYNPPRPGLVRLTPDFAPTTGTGGPVELSGFFFSNRFGAPRVTFDGQGNDDVSVDAIFISADTLQVQPPPHSAGNVNVTVANAIEAGAYGTPSEPRAFQYIQPVGNAPVLSTINPAAGSSDGGESVTLTGTDFSATPRVFFGAVEGTVLVATSTSITVRTPTQSRDGAVDVRVVNPDGQTGTLSAAFTLTFAAPAINIVTPNVGVDSGGTPVIVAGAGFRAGVTARFVRAGGADVAALAVSRLSATSLLVTTPVLAAGAATLVVRNVDGQEASAAFSFVTPSGPAPTISFLDPESGGVSGNNPVSIFGAGFVGARVFFADAEIAAETIEFIPGDGGRLDELRVSAPPATAVGTVAVRLVNDDGQSAATAYTYALDENPRISFASPDRVHTVGNDTLNIFGENLLTLGATPTATLIVGAQSVTATVRGTSDTLVAVQLRNVSLPAGVTSSTATLRLQGQGRTVTTAAFTIAAPVPQEVSINGGRIEIFGSDLNGARLRDVVLTTSTGPVACVPTIRADFFVRCTPASTPNVAVGERLVVALSYNNAFGAPFTSTTANVPAVVVGNVAGPDCRLDEDCGAGFVCDQGTCVEDVVETCQQDIDCGRPSICEANTCVDPECIIEQDCPRPGDVCDDGRCKDPTGACESDLQCFSGDICEENTCVPAECETSAQCLDGEICSEGRCGGVVVGEASLIAVNGGNPVAWGDPIPIEGTGLNQQTQIVLEFSDTGVPHNASIPVENDTTATIVNATSIPPGAWTVRLGASSVAFTILPPSAEALPNGGFDTATGIGTSLGSVAGTFIDREPHFFLGIAAEADLRVSLVFPEGTCLDGSIEIFDDARGLIASRTYQPTDENTDGILECPPVRLAASVPPALDYFVVVTGGGGFELSVEGSECQVRDDCDPLDICDEGLCIPAECVSPGECDVGEDCIEGVCRALPGCGDGIIDVDFGETCDSADQGCVECQEVAEPNDTIETATLAEGPPNGALAPTGDVDHYLVEGISGETVFFFVRLDGSPCNPNDTIEVFTAAGENVGTPLSPINGHCAEVRAAFSGDVVLRVSSPGSAPFRYGVNGEGIRIDFVNNGQTVFWPDGFPMEGQGLQGEVFFDFEHNATGARRTLPTEVLSETIVNVSASSGIAPGAWLGCANGACAGFVVAPPFAESEPNDFDGQATGILEGAPIEATGDGTQDVFFALPTTDLISVTIDATDGIAADLQCDGMFADVVVDGSPVDSVALTDCEVVTLQDILVTFGEDVFVEVGGIPQDLVYRVTLDVSGGGGDFDFDGDGIPDQDDPAPDDPCVPDPQSQACGGQGGEPICGNGAVEAGEACDVGGFGVGCTSTCQEALGFFCTHTEGSPSVCHAGVCNEDPLTGPLGTGFFTGGNGVSTSAAGATSNADRGTITTDDLEFPVVVEVDLRWTSGGLAFVGTRSAGEPNPSEPDGSLYARIHNNVGGNNSMSLATSSAGADILVQNDPVVPPSLNRLYHVRFVDDGFFTTSTWTDLEGDDPPVVVSTSSDVIVGSGNRAVLSGDAGVTFSNLRVCSAATFIPVDNSSFEDVAVAPGGQIAGVSGWSGVADTARPNDFTPIEGFQTMVITPGNNISQSLPSSFQPDSRVSLMGIVFARPLSESVEVTGTFGGEDFLLPIPSVEGTPFRHDIEVASGSPQAGQPISIAFTGGDVGETHIDAVVIRSQSVVLTPDP